MSICACCSLPMDPEQAEHHNLCQVCEIADCTPHHAAHENARLADHHGEEEVRQSPAT